MELGQILNFAGEPILLDPTLYADFHITGTIMEINVPDLAARSRRRAL
jgi:hypothetical protein